MGILELKTSTTNGSSINYKELRRFVNSQVETYLYKEITEKVNENIELIMEKADPDVSAILQVDYLTINGNHKDVIIDKAAAVGKNRLEKDEIVLKSIREGAEEPIVYTPEYLFLIDNINSIIHIIQKIYK